LAATEFNEVAIQQVETLHSLSQRPPFCITGDEHEDEGSEYEPRGTRQIVA
jgi:hypothetical protein